jgi:hypothetical protein
VFTKFVLVQLTPLLDNLKPIGDNIDFDFDLEDDFDLDFAFYCNFICRRNQNLAFG